MQNYHSPSRSVPHSVARYQIFFPNFLQSAVQSQIPHWGDQIYLDGEEFSRQSRKSFRNFQNVEMRLSAASSFQLAALRNLIRFFSVRISLRWCECPNIEICCRRLALNKHPAPGIRLKTHYLSAGFSSTNSFAFSLHSGDKSLLPSSE